MPRFSNDNELKPSKLEPLRLYLSAQIIPISVLLLIFVVAAIMSPVFLSFANITNLLLQVAVNMIVSMGMFMIILSGGIDLSVGSVLAVCGVLVAGFMESFGIIPAIILAVLAGTCLGTANGILVAKVKVAPFIVTLGMMSVARGIAFWYTNAVPILWSHLPGVEGFRELSSGQLFGIIPYPAVLWAILAIVAFFIIRFTTVGRVLYAIGGNEEAGRLSGINTSLYKIFPYAYTGFLCGVGGVLLTSRLGVGSPASGVGLELDSIAAVVIGGTRLSGGEGSISGVIIGVFILGIINNILNLMNVPSYPQQMLKGVIIVTAVILSSKRMRKI